MKRLFFVFIVPVIFASCSVGLEKGNLVIINSSGGKIPLEVELAVTPEARQQGYMHRRNVPRGEGMLFVFPADQILSFWMKNTSVPLSIAYISSKGEIMEIHDLTPFSEKPVPSSRSVRYALEVPQGWFEDSGISEGCYVEFTPELKHLFSGTVR